MWVGHAPSLRQRLDCAQPCPRLSPRSPPPQLPLIAPSLTPRYPLITPALPPQDGTGKDAGTDLSTVRYQVCRLIRMLVQVCRTLDKVPAEVSSRRPGGRGIADLTGLGCAFAYDMVAKIAQSRNGPVTAGGLAGRTPRPAPPYFDHFTIPLCLTSQAKPLASLLLPTRRTTAHLTCLVLSSSSPASLSPPWPTPSATCS